MYIYLIQAYRNNVAQLPAATTSEETAKQLKRGWEKSGHTVVIYRFDIKTQGKNWSTFSFPTQMHYLTLK